METDRLRQFCTIIEAGSLTQAAKLLGISHGGLSKSISVLERDLGVKLFKPQGRGNVATEAGLEIYRSSASILTQVDALTKPAVARELDRLRVGVLEVFTSHFIGDLVSTHFPERPVQCMEFDPGQMESAILDNRVDYGLTYLPVSMAGLEHVEVRAMRMGVFARKGSFRKAPLREVPFVTPALPAPLNPLGIKERDGWPDGIFPRKKRYSCNLLSSAMDLTRSGLCAIFIPEFLAELHNRNFRQEFALEALPWPKEVPSPHRKVYLVARVGTVEGVEMRKLARAIRESI
jgi:DNA-binding transcriptional LysR family regulator